MEVLSSPNITIAYVLMKVLELLVIVRAILRPNREPTSRFAWVVVISVVPLVGMVAYLLLGETSIGRKRLARIQCMLESLPDFNDRVGQQDSRLTPSVPDRFASLFRLGHTISGFQPVGGNHGHLTLNSNDAIRALVNDIDSARIHVHLCFYIWLADNNGLLVVEALKRAVKRGVTCRAMADSLGSRSMIRSRHWRDMRNAGVKLGVALPIGNPLFRPLNGRIDLRNHRKNVVIDDWITYCGSQNCADPEFTVKPKYAPWVDAMMRFEGPIARQNQHVFISDWMSWVREDLRELLDAPLRAETSGFTAQVIATGPSVRASAAPEMFASLMYAARDELIITSPYFVPNEALQAALCAAANRGVETTVVFPERNDSFVVAAASRSYYRALLEAGVKIHEYGEGLLHTKSMTVDGQITLIGSANMDRRSFELNYENNILFYDPALTADMVRRQQVYLKESRLVTLAEVNGWSTSRVLWYNTLAMLGPLL